MGVQVHTGMQKTTLGAIPQVSFHLCLFYDRAPQWPDAPLLVQTGQPLAPGALLTPSPAVGLQAHSTHQALLQRCWGSNPHTKQALYPLSYGPRPWLDILNLKCIVLSIIHHSFKSSENIVDMCTISLSQGDKRGQEQQCVCVSMCMIRDFCSGQHSNTKDSLDMVVQLANTFFFSSFFPILCVYKSILKSRILEKVYGQMNQV